MQLGPLNGWHAPLASPVARATSSQASGSPDAVDLQSDGAHQPAIARVLKILPDSARALHATRLQAILASPGPVAVGLATIGVEVMRSEADGNRRARIGHELLSTIQGLGEAQSQSAGNILRLVTLDEPLAAQTYQTGLLSMLPLPEESPGPGLGLGKVHPGQDLFELANSRSNSKPWWRFWAPQPQGRDALTREASHRLTGQVWSELTKAASPPHGSAAQRVQDFLAAASDRLARDSAGLKPAQPYLERVEGMKSHAELGPILQHLHRAGIASLVNPSQRALAHGKAALMLLPNAETFGSDLHRARHDPDFPAYAAALFQARGDAPDRAADKAGRVLATANRLLDADISQVEILTFDTPFMLEGSQPGLGWKEYQTPGPIATEHPGHLESLSQALASLPLDELKLFMEYSVLNSLSGDLTFDLLNAHDQSNQRMGDKRRNAAELTRDYLAPVLQQAFADKVVTPGRKAEVEQVFEDVREVYRDRIARSPDFTQSTREAALDKLAKMRLEVGAPPDGFPRLEADIKPDRHFENVQQIRAQYYRQLFSGVSMFGWGRTDEVNAYAQRGTNAVIMTAGYLLDPRLQGATDRAALYGIVGFTLAHEVGHHFEPEGLQNDADGKKRAWADPRDMPAFDQKFAAIERQLQADPTCTLETAKGYLCETVADLSGLSVAYEAFLKRNEHRALRDGTTPEQRFFINFAATLSEREKAASRNARSKHPLNQFRVNNAARNMPAYAAAFGLSPGAPMLFEQSKRAGLF